MTVHLHKPTDNDFKPFDARDLVNVVDRVETPFRIDVNGGVIDVHHVERYSWGTEVFTDADHVERFNLDDAVMIELVGPVAVLDADDDVIAYTTRDGELLCADHGAVHDIGVEDGYVHPVFRGQRAELDAVEWCGHGHPGHSFCGACGTTLEGTRGAHDRDIEGHFARCWNCDTTSVYVDGEGYSWVSDIYGFADVLNRHTVEVYGPTVTYQTDLNGYTKITHVIDEAPSLMRELKCFVSWQEARPYDGVILTLSDSWESADEAAMDYWRDELLPADDFPADDDEAADFRADFRTVEVPADQVWFHTKH